MVSNPITRLLYLPEGHRAPNTTLRNLPVCAHYNCDYCAFGRKFRVCLVAIHRFFEVSLGIAIGLMLAARWPERRPGLAARVFTTER